MEGDRAVEEQLVTRYQDSLGLQTITDFRSRTWLGRFANCDLLDRSGHRVHEHHALAAWPRSTRSCRTGHFPSSSSPSWSGCSCSYPSKKQTQMNMRMMEVQKKLAPQIEELKKKHADNPHEFNRAKMQLMMANGVNPFAAHGRLPAPDRADAGDDGPLLLPAGKRLLPARAVPVGQQPRGTGHAVLVGRAASRSSARRRIWAASSTSGRTSTSCRCSRSRS